MIVSDAAEAASISPRSLAKQLNMGNAHNLERKIKRELELEGLTLFARSIYHNDMHGYSM